jgi:hypothetical protein
LAALAARRPLPGAAKLAHMDVDSLLRRVYGPAKQGAAFGQAKVGGYIAAYRTCRSVVEDVVAGTRLQSVRRTP